MTSLLSFPPPPFPPFTLHRGLSLEQRRKHTWSLRAGLLNAGSSVQQTRKKEAHGANIVLQNFIL